MGKAKRQNTILQLLESQSIASQEDLRKALWREGVRVTQATLSRDIREIGLVKGGDGYQFPAGGLAPLTAEQALPSADRLVREFVLSARPAQNLIVVKTAVGSAGPVAASLDSETWPEVMGTIAGDDTVLVVTETMKAAQKLASRLEGLLA